MNILYIAGSLTLFISVLLVLIVLIQNSKGGGLSSTFGASSISSMIGARKATQDIEKFTWYLAGGLMVLAFVANAFSSPADLGTKETRMKNQIENQSYQTNSIPSTPGE